MAIHKPLTVMNRDEHGEGTEKAKPYGCASSTTRRSLAKAAPLLPAVQLMAPSPFLLEAYVEVDTLQQMLDLAIQGLCHFKCRENRWT
jgi:hypothetical protein